MSWRTPCVDNPESWTDGNPQERYDAQQACLGCHRLAQCAAEAEADPDERIGVRGGTDWTVTVGGQSQASRNCSNTRCGRVVLQNATGRPRLFCNDKCRTIARDEAAA